MLSILIPEYNYNCTKLVNDLYAQCQKAGFPFEILVMDDSSTLHKEENRTLSEIPGCRFIEVGQVGQNLGCTKTKNSLASLAQYPYLLIIDCDMGVVDDRYIQRYAEAMGKAPVVIGGSRYCEEKVDADRLLRWHYGRNRESLPAAIRNQHPWKATITQNAMIEKSLFDNIHFDEQFKDYGHEDTLWGITLKQNGIQVLHIDNQLYHNGLDKSEVFLAKSLKAVEKYVTVPQIRTREAIKDIRIFKAYNTVKKLRLDRLLALKYRYAGKCMVRNLCGKHPSLFIFDFYRLSYLCSYCLKQKL